MAASAAGAAAPARSPVGAEPLPADPRLDAVLDELRALRDGLDERFAELRGELAPAPTLTELKRARPEPDWAALDALVALRNADPEAAKQEVLLLDQTAALQRFGTPTSVWGSAGRLTWMYGRDFVPSTENYRAEVKLVFRGGRATEVYVEFH